jgi:hypothetical protein
MSKRWLPWMALIVLTSQAAAAQSLNEIATREKERRQKNKEAGVVAASVTTNDPAPVSRAADRRGTPARGWARVAFTPVASTDDGDESWGTVVWTPVATGTMATPALPSVNPRREHWLRRMAETRREYLEAVAELQAAQYSPIYYTGKLTMSNVNDKIWEIEKAKRKVKSAEFRMQLVETDAAREGVLAGGW